MALIETIVRAMEELDEDVIYPEVQKALDAGAAKMDIIESLQQGMATVGDLFAARKYFLSELMLSAEIFGECQKLLGGEDAVDAQNGAFVMGTVYGDIHDIGKNIVVSVMKSNGFKVIDLGVDVKPEAYIAAIKEHAPKAVGFSCLLTTAFDAMKDCIGQIRAAGLDKGRLLLIGGGPCEEGTVQYVNADGLCKTAQNTVERTIAFINAG